MVKEVTYTQDSKTIPMFTEEDYDPDPNYVLTMDNAKKIIAIHQRLRYPWLCNIRTDILTGLKKYSLYKLMCIYISYRET